MAFFSPVLLFLLCFSLFVSNHGPINAFVLFSNKIVRIPKGGSCYSCSQDKHLILHPHLIQATPQNCEKEASEKKENPTPQQDILGTKNEHYLTAGGMYEISSGPDHHLINVDHEQLDSLGDKSVNVHELKLDAVTVTFVTFAFGALCLFGFAFIDGELVSNVVARVQNALIMLTIYSI
jgi:hypothetical protein